MACVIGIDSGGTKTETVLVRTTGEILCRDLKSGGNAMDIGEAEAKKVILSAVTDVLKKAEQSGERVVTLYGGIAGIIPFGDFLSAYLSEKTGLEKVRIEDDGNNMISGTFGHEDACCIVCGTGSSMYVRIKGKPLVHIGGLGYLIDTGGSGFEIGQAALKAVFRELDGRGEKTVLTELITEVLGKDPRKSMAEIYTGGRAFIASLSHTVFEGCLRKDPVSERIFDQGAYALAELTLAAEKYFAGQFRVALNGGMFTSHPDYAAAVREKSSKRAVMVLAEVPPVYGAAVEAMWDAGMEPDKAFRENFMAFYMKCKEKRQK